MKEATMEEATMEEATMKASRASLAAEPPAHLAVPTGSVPLRRPARALAAPESSAWSWDQMLLLAGIAALLVVRWPLILHRSFDPDEFEHVHAAWNLSHGLVPYRDFFEHHTPLYYLLLAPFFPFFEVETSFESARAFLTFARGISLALTGLSVFLLVRLASRGADRRVGLLAGLFFLMPEMLLDKTLECRPDVLALPFFLAALSLLAGRVGPRDQEVEGSLNSFFALRAFLGAGLLLGAGILCTQKMLFALPGVVGAGGLWALAGGRARLPSRVAALGAVLVGVALPVALAWGIFAALGGGRAFVVNNFLLNAHWKLHSSRHVRLMLETTWPFLALAAVGMATCLRRVVHERLLLLATTAGLFAGLLVVPAAYRQYYLMPLPLVCVFAADGLTGLARRVSPRQAVWLALPVVMLLARWPILHLLAARGDRNDRQMERLRYVLGRTRPGDLVLDGWLGTQLFRPQPVYYGFLHREIFAMLTPAELDAYLGPLESGRVKPALITLDTELRFLGARFARYLQANYVTNDGEFYWPVAARRPRLNDRPTQPARAVETP